MNLKELAKEYVAPKKLNIADLDVVNLNDIEIYQNKGKDKDDKTFVYHAFKIGDNEFRVPNIVIEKIQEILKLKPTVTKINVIREGTGYSTKYKVEALD